MIREWVFRTSLKLFMPGLARQMKLEGTFHLDADKMPKYVHVTDNGADVTVFIFSGLDVLFAGFARFEFGRMLKRLGDRCNFVFLRDIHRSSYYYQPDGRPGGPEFFQREVERLKKELGARHNIALGSSAGGGAAIYFGTVCGFDHVIAFGPAIPWYVYTRLSAQLKSLLNVKLLVTEARAYLEVLMVTCGATITLHELRRHLSDEDDERPFHTYRDAPRRPTATIFYGRRSGPDAQSAAILGQFPEVTCVPLETGRHNTPEFLHNRGELGDVLTREIEAVIARDDADANTGRPQKS